MKRGLKIYKAEFEGIYPVGTCLVMSHYSLEEAEKMARETITHTTEIKVEEVKVKGPQVIEYLSGNY